MEQKLTTTENQHPAFGALFFWPVSLFINPMAMDPVSWSNDLFDITYRNMAQMFEGFLGNWSTFHNQPLTNENENSFPAGLEAKDIDISTNGELYISISKSAQLSKEQHVEEKAEKEHKPAAPITSMKNNGHRKEKQHP